MVVFELESVFIDENHGIKENEDLVADNQMNTLFHQLDTSMIMRIEFFGYIANLYSFNGTC